MEEKGKILALDSSGLVASVAVVCGDTLVGEYTVNYKKTHSQTLLPMLEALKNMVELDLSSVDAIALAAGPGSFTGLRIGLAAAKAMAYALNLPIVGVSTLKALAYHYPVPGIRIVSLLDAQKGNAYRESYEWQDGKLQVVQPVEVLPLAEIIAECAESGRPVVLLGDVAAKRVRGKMELPANVEVAPAHLIMPRAACVAMLGLEEFAAGHHDNVMNMEPVYIRRSEAEVLWEKRHPEAAK